MTDEGTIATSTPEEETPATAPATEAPAAPETPAETPPPAPDTSVGAEVATDVNKAEDVAGTVLDDADEFTKTVEGEIASAKAGLENLKAAAEQYSIESLVNGTIAHFKGVIANLEAAVGVKKASK